MDLRELTQEQQILISVWQAKDLDTVKAAAPGLCPSGGGL